MEKEYIGIIGLGYVGLPLACLLATRHRVVGFDLNAKRVEELSRGTDSTGEVPEEDLRAALAHGMTCTADKEELKPCRVYIVAVPTPVDSYHRPLLAPLEAASHTVGECIGAGDLVIYESTVYPGVTEEVCQPVIEQVSGLTCNRDFFIGYSPERINPGDREHRIENILKITSGSTPEAAERTDALYRSVLKGGTYRAPSIRVAEAAKVIENSQRDVNIAFMNEITQILNTLDIDVTEVLKAAGTKWNFLPFRPGLVGGHCISIDPYYLIQRAELCGVYPRLMIEARRINDTMGYYMTEHIIRTLNFRNMLIHNARILLLGFAFKADCADIRNTQVINIYRSLSHYTPHVCIYDPHVDADAVMKEYGVRVETDAAEITGDRYDAVVRCVCHSRFRELDLAALCRPQGLLFEMDGSVRIPGEEPNQDILLRQPII